MKKTINKYWKKTENIRQSLPNYLHTENLLHEETDDADLGISLHDSINNRLMEYKEIKMIYKKFGVKPVYYLYGLFCCLFLIFIGYFADYLTILIATLYPLYISIKTLQSEENKEEIKQWLTYW